ncbi:MAG: adenylyltransferase/cytidyltransferase family protein [Peptoniphilus sp.]|nr:adenylyltransferase/cytidyltransferase family protein [Peptoniphilus sp.]
MVIGYTTGVYDMFHIGHLNLLENAKKKCYYFIFGLSTDEVFIKEKKKTPVIPFKERRSIVAAIRYVDKVVAQDSKDKYGAWERLGFHKMFVGDDWKGSDAWNNYEKQFASTGVQIVYLPHTDGVSSTKLTAYIKGIIQNNGKDESTGLCSENSSI